MCIVFSFLCPWCGSSSGKTALDPCRRDPCVGLEPLERFTFASHFKGWFCTTERCPYSKASRLAAREEVRAFKRAQAAGKARPDEPDVEMGDADDTDDSDSDSDSDSDDQLMDDGLEDMDVDLEAEEPEEANNNERPAGVASPSAAPASNPNPAAARQGGGAARALPVFDQATNDRIAQLRQEIARSAPPGNKWIDEEDELLLLLRRHRVTYVQMAESFIIRHPANGCETRGSVLLRRQRREADAADA